MIECPECLRTFPQILKGTIDPVSKASCRIVEPRFATQSSSRAMRRFCCRSSTDKFNAGWDFIRYGRASGPEEKIQKCL
jgi:hypothetical protein